MNEKEWKRILYLFGFLLVAYFGTQEGNIVHSSSGWLLIAVMVIVAVYHLGLLLIACVGLQQFQKQAREAEEERATAKATAAETRCPAEGKSEILMGGKWVPIK